MAKKKEQIPDSQKALIDQCDRKTRISQKRKIRITQG